ncbi:MAG: hypothetical protein AAB777_01065 [Patescibacteria group bacterium]
MQDNQKNRQFTIPASIIIAGTLIAIAIIFKWTPARNISDSNRLDTQSFAVDSGKNSANQEVISVADEEVTPSTGVVLPIVWGNLGVQLASAGAIDANKFKALYEQRSMFTDEEKNLLTGQNNNKLKITPKNAGYLLNLFWALGLAQNNPVLMQGEMMDIRYGGPQRFASTAGWTIAKGDPMDHYSKHTFFNLTPEQQTLVENVSENIYRPCCGNSTHFPDCNHGMAMLGLLELMASQGASEQDMYKTALTVNSYWFPDQYATIAQYLKQKGIEWKTVIPKTILGADFSSGQGFAKIAEQVAQPIQKQGGGGCGVDSGQPVDAPKQQGGCGI